MPIDFYCKHCLTYLRTPEEKAGLSTQCPTCWERIWVPLESEERIPPEKWPVEAAPGAGNDPSRGRRSGRQPSVLDDHERRSRAAVRPRRPADLGTILSTTWRIYSDNLGICLVATVIDVLVTIVALLIVIVPASLCVLALWNAPVLCIPAMMLTLFLGWTLALSASAAGHYRFFLALARGERVQVGQLFHWGDHLGRMAVASVAFWAITIFGLCLFILPGILAIVLFWPYGRLVVDEDAPASQSLSDALFLTRDNFRTSFLIVMLNLLMISVAHFVPLLGYFLVIPFCAVLHSVAYLEFRGELIASQR